MMIIVLIALCSLIHHHCLKNNPKSTYRMSPRNIGNLAMSATPMAQNSDKPLLYYNLFCYFLSICLHTCMCNPSQVIGSKHDNSRSRNPCMTPKLAVNPSNKDDDLDPKKLLKSIKTSNLDRLVIGQLNINSLRNKYEALKYQKR